MMGIMIIAITSMVIIVNVNAVSGQSAKREADKLANWLVSRMTIADSQNKAFKLKINSTGNVFLHWGESELNEADKEYFSMSKGCTFQLSAPNDKLEYRPETNNFTQGGHITVTGKEGPTAPYYVIIAVIGSRVRVSDTKP